MLHSPFQKKMFPEIDTVYCAVVDTYLIMTKGAITGGRQQLTKQDQARFTVELTKQIRDSRPLEASTLVRIRYNMIDKEAQSKAKLLLTYDLNAISVAAIPAESADFFGVAKVFNELEISNIWFFFARQHQN